jgi:hypothetical protein
MATGGFDVVLGNPAEKANSSFEPTPRYWVPERDVVGRLATKG